MVDVSSESTSNGARGQIQSVARAAQLLMLVAERRVDPTGKELAAAANLAVPTAHHLLATLVSQGLLVKDSYFRYVLGPRIAVLADAYQRDVSPPEYLLEPLRKLAMTTGEAGYLAVWRQSGIHVLAVVEGRLPVRVSIPSGPYLDAHARATGKLMLALVRDDVRDAYLRTHPLRALTPRTITNMEQLQEDLEVTRQRGYGIDEEEFQLGVSCISAPIRDSGVIVATYALSIPTERFEKRRRELLDALLTVVAGVRLRSVGADKAAVDVGEAAAPASGSGSSKRTQI